MSVTVSSAAPGAATTDGTWRRRLEEQVAVDLVGDEHQAVAAAEVDHGGHLGGAPDAPQGVVRVAEEQHPGRAA